MAERVARASTAANEDSFETALAAASTAIQLQRKRARSQLVHSSGKRSKKNSLGESVIRMVSAVTDSEQPLSREDGEVVAWTRDAITRFAEARAERVRTGQGGLSRLPPEVAVDALSLIERLASMLE